MAPERTTHPVQEPSGVFLRPILGAVIGFIAFVLGGMVLLLQLYKPFAPVGTRPPRPFPAPALQASPEIDYGRYLAAQRAELDRTGWVDRAHGVRAIPIEQAMELIGERGPAGYDPIPGASKEGGNAGRPAGAVPPADRPFSPGAGNSPLRGGSRP
jgi:hypothetical protein